MPARRRCDGGARRSTDAARTEHLGFRDAEVSDVDITKAPFLLAIGRGVEDGENVARFEELADRLGATLSVSRPLVDAGWVPSARQVGQSGRTVKPRVYLALGISGAIQHLAGMRSSETIIAVNTDPEAPIFGVAHYGAVADMFELADELERAAGVGRARERGDPGGLLAFHAVAEGAVVRARGAIGRRVRLRRRGVRSPVTAAAGAVRGRRIRGARFRDGSQPARA